MLAESYPHDCKASRSKMPYRNPLLSRYVLQRLSIQDTAGARETLISDEPFSDQQLYQLSLFSRSGCIPYITWQKLIANTLQKTGLLWPSLLPNTEDGACRPSHHPTISPLLQHFTYSDIHSSHVGHSIICLAAKRKEKQRETPLTFLHQTNNFWTECLYSFPGPAFQTANQFSWIFFKEDNERGLVNSSPFQCSFNH